MTRSLGCALFVVLLPYQGLAENQLLNSSFESGSKAPWYSSLGVGYSDPWQVSDTESHSGTFSATNVAIGDIVQYISPTSTSKIGEVSFWAKNDLATISYISLYFSSSWTLTLTTTMPANPVWTQYDVTWLLPSGENLIGIGLNFYGDSNSLNVIYVDDVMIDAVPEPGSMIVLGLGVLAALRRHKKLKLGLPFVSTTPAVAR